MTVAAKDLSGVQPAEQQQQHSSWSAAWPEAAKRAAAAAHHNMEHLERKAAKIYGTVRPRLRGVPDCFAAVAAVPAAAVLTAHAQGPLPTVAALVYGLSVFTMFTVSAIYHTIVWPLPTRLTLRKVDHSAIYVLIAGSYTPLCLTALPQAYGAVMLAAVWAITVLGALKAVLWDDAPRLLNTGIFIAQGWLIVPIAPMVYSSVHPESWMLLLAGGLLYTVGAMVFQHRWPDPYPRHWGHHEIFHVFIIGAVCCHYRCFWNLVTSPPLPGTMASPLEFIVSAEA